MKLIQIAAGVYWHIRQAWREKRVTLEINLGEVLLAAVVLYWLVKKD